MVSMNQMRDLIDEDDFSEFFDSSPQPSSSMNQHEQQQQQPVKKGFEKAVYEPDLTKPTMNHQQQQSSNNQSSSVDQAPSSPRDEDIMKKLKEVDAFMADYSGVSVPREQIWKSSQLLSMDQLLEYDDEEPTTHEQQPIVKDIHEPVKEARAPVIEEKQQFQQQQQPRYQQQQQEPPQQPKEFNSTEALSLLLNIQKSSEDAKFDLIDGFLDKYKIEHKKNASRADSNQRPSAYNAPLNNRMTASQIFEQIVAEKQPSKVVAPFCVQPRSNNHQVELNQMDMHNRNHHKSVDLSPSYSTYEALQNVEVCEPNAIDAPKLDTMISSNKSDKARDNLYWERRRVNNEAAHRSRAKRKRLIEEKTERIQYFEEENPKLKFKLESVLKECAGLKRKLAFYEKYQFK